MQEFLLELTELCKKHNIGIGGCGCDGSPYLFDLESGEIIGENLDYDLLEDKYEYTVFIPTGEYEE